MELKSSLPPLYHDLSRPDLDNSLAENAKFFTSDTDHESPLVSRPQTYRPSNHNSVFPSTAQIRVLCYSLHGVLLAIHIVLLGLWTHHVEHQVVMPIGPFSNSLSVGLTVALQAFFTMFQAALVVSTQQLALRRNLLRYQTLTATHDQSNAWTGFGAALMSLWSQTRLSAATFGVSSVALYLLSISVLHVSSSSLINVETFNATYPTTVATVLGMPSDMESIFTSDYDWYDATAVASMVGQLTELTTVGVTNATLYDTLSNTAGIGLASVTSTTLLATCRSLPNITVSGSEPNTYSDSTALYNITAAGGYSTIALTYADALLANALKYYGWIDGPSEQIGQLVFCITPPILDAQGNSGSTFSFQRQIISKDGEPVGNETVVVQAMGCSISYANETGTVDVQTNQLLQPSIPPTQPAIWETLQWPVVDEVDDITGFLSDGFDHAAFSLEQWAPMGTPLGYSNLLEYRLMSLLGLQTEGSVFNQSTVSTPPITLNEFQSALAEVTAAIVWTGARMNTTPAFLGQEFQLSTGETEVTMSAVKARLNINILPVVVGFGASTILFGLAILMIRGPDGDRGTDDPAVDSTGVLQVLWLASRHSVACEQVARVASPSNNKLRKAGMFNISFSRISSSTDQSPLRISRQNLVQMGSVNSRGDPSEHSPLTPNRLAPYDQSRGGRQATDMFLEMDELDTHRGFIYPHRTTSRTSSTASDATKMPSILPWLCYSSYGLLVAIHLVLLALWSHRLEHQISVPIGSASNSVSVALTVIQQAFFTIYQAGIVYMTQRLALRVNLLSSLTLTAVHDMCDAWSGLGAACISLWRQIKVPAAPRGVSFIALYLASIAVLHVSSSSLLNLETFNATYQAISPVAIGMPLNLWEFGSTYDASENLTALAGVAGKLSELSTPGLSGGTVFDTVTDTSGFGNASVNATTFLSNCWSLPDLTLGASPVSGVYNVSSASVNMVSYMSALPQNSITMSYGIFPLGETTDSPVVRTIFFAIPAIPDAQGNTGSTLPVQRTISFPDGSSLNETVEMQAMACAWSAINQTGTLDVSTNTLLSVNPVAPQPSSQWLTLDPSAINDDATMQEINGFSTVWLPGLPSGINRTSPCDVSADNYLGGCEFSNIDIRIMDALGRYTNLGAGNQSSVSTPAVTLSDLEKALGDVFGAFFWAGARISEGPLSRSSLDFQKAVTKMYPESRLNINVVPVVFGLAASTTLFVLAIVLTRMHATPDAMTTRPAVISAGILQVLWLSARHSHARERIAEVEEPEPDALRKAGMFAVSLGRVPTDEYSWTIESSGTDAFGSTEHLKP